MENKLNKILYKTTLFLILLCSAGRVFAQQIDREKGIDLYNKGDYAGAVENLKKAVSQNSRDVVALHYSGLAAEKQSQPDEAVKNYQKAIEVCVKLLEGEIEKTLEVGKNNGQAIKEALAKDLAAEMSAAIESSNRFTELKPEAAGADNWQTMILTLKTLNPNKPKPDADLSTAAITKVAVKNKPDPEYPESAMRKFTTGNIRLYVLFLPNGKIGLAVPFNRLPDGVTESAIAAAKNIKFEPATQNDKPIAVWLQIIYVFGSGRRFAPGT